MGATASGSTGGSGGCTPGASVTCYDGPTSTQNVGLCRAGLKTCNTDGMTYGACVGQVIPAPENCATPVDEDCDGLAPACKGVALWSKRAGDISDQYGLGVAVDGANNVLVTGQYSGAIDFGGCLLSTSATTGLFVAKLDPQGVCLWNRGAGDAGSQYGHHIAVDAAGNAVITGEFIGALDLGGCPLSKNGGTGLFVAKLDPSGVCLWSKNAGDAGSQNGSGVAVDSADNVLITGDFTSAMDLGGCPLSKPSGHGLFVAKLDPSGACLWSKSAGDAGKQTGYGVAIDSADSVLITGGFAGALDLGGCPLSKAGTSATFIAKLDLSGACQWSKSAGETAVGNAVAVDGGGNILVTGSYDGAVDFGACPLSKAAGSGVYVAKLDASGGCLWNKGAGDAGNHYGHGVAVDSTGNVMVTGSFDGLLDFGGGSFVSASNDFFVVKLDATGGYLWSRRAGGPTDDDGNDVAVDGAGNVLVTGAFNETADFGTGPLASAGGADIFVAKFAP